MPSNLMQQWGGAIGLPVFQGKEGGLNQWIDLMGNGTNEYAFFDNFLTQFRRNDTNIDVTFPVMVAACTRSIQDEL